MALVHPTLIRSADSDPCLTGSVVAWWSSAAMGVNAKPIGAGGVVSGSFSLWVAGLSSFMLYIHQTAAVPLGIELQLLTIEETPISISYATDLAPAALDQMRTLGQFSQNFVDGTFSTATMIAWVLAIGPIHNDGAVPTVVSMQLFGGRR